MQFQETYFGNLKKEIHTVAESNNVNFNENNFANPPC